MAALVTTLYTQHSKAKAKATEVATTFASVVGRTIAIEYEWKFVDQAGFKSLPTETQKSILVNTLGHNLNQCLLGTQDSLASALAVSAPLRDLFVTITKIVFSYDYASTIASTVGAAHLNIFVDGSILGFKTNLNAVQVLNNGDWGVTSKLLALTSSTAIPSSTAASHPIESISIMTTPPAKPATSNVMISPPSVSAPVAAASAPAAASAKVNRVGGSPGGNGVISFLYTGIEKVKKRVGEISRELSTRLGSDIIFDVDLNSLVKNPTFMKESQADQKALLASAPDSWAGALYAAMNGSSTIEVALRAQPGMNKVKWEYVPSNQPTPGWSFLEVSGSGTDLFIKCSIANSDEIYGVAVENATSAPAAAAIPMHQDSLAAFPVLVSQPPIVVQPATVPIPVLPVAMPDAAPEPVTVPSPNILAPAAAAPGAAPVAVKPSGHGILEEFGVTPAMRRENERLQHCLASFNLGCTVEYEVDSSFIHDKKLRWSDCGTQKTVLKSISIEPWSIFRVITDAAIMIIRSGDASRKHFLDTYVKFQVSFESSDPAIKVPHLVLNEETKTLHIICSFVNMYTPRKWIDVILADKTIGHTFNGTTIEELFQAKMASLGGWLEAMAREEAMTIIAKTLAPHFEAHFEGRIVPIEVDWEALDRRNSGCSDLVRMKKHYEFPKLVLDVVFKSFNKANLAVIKILRAKLQCIRVIAITSDSAVLHDQGALMEISYTWANPSCLPLKYKVEIEQQVREKCEGLTVKNASAEIAMQTASPFLAELNRSLHDDLGMVSPEGGYDILVVDYPSFVDTPEFFDKYHISDYSVIWEGNVEDLRGLVRGFVEASKNTVGGLILKTVKRIHIGFDVSSKSDSTDAPLDWDPATGTFTVTYTFRSFSHPLTYDYTPRIEYATGIVFEFCRMETRTRMEKFYSTVKSDFGLPSLPVIMDESYQNTPEFKSLARSSMKPIMMRFLTTLPPSIFHGPMGLLHCSEFPKARQILHDKVKKIRILPDGLLASNTNQVELIDGELVVRIAYDSQEWETPIGYQLSQIIGSRSTIEAEAIAEVDTALVAYSSLMRSHTKNSNFLVKFNWEELLQDSIFQASQNYVDLVRLMLQYVKRTFDGSGKELATYDQGMTWFLQEKKDDGKQSLAEHMASLDTLEYHVDTKNTISTQGQFGLFTPYRYRAIKDNRTLHIHFNLSEYPVGIGSIVEWVCAPESAADRQTEWVNRIAHRNYLETLEAQERAVKAAKEENQTNLDKYCAETERVRLVYHPNLVPHYLPKLHRPVPIPTFKSISPTDFVAGQDRIQLRNNHWMENQNRFEGDPTDLDMSQVEDEAVPCDNGPNYEILTYIR